MSSLAPGARRNSGIAVLELSALLVVMLPLLIGLYSVVWLTNARTTLDNIAEKHAKDGGLKIYRLGTGDQAYFQTLADRYAGNNADDRSSSAKGIADLMTRIAESAAEEVRQKFYPGCGAACEQFFRVEFRMADFNIDTASGVATHITCDAPGHRPQLTEDEYCKAPAGTEEFWGGHGRFDQTEGSRGRFYRIVGAINNPGFDQTYTITKLRELVGAGGGEPNLYAVPAGFSGAVQKQKYGYTEMRSGRRINYLRKTAVFALDIQLDYSQTIAGKILSLFNAQNEVNQQQPKPGLIKAFRFMTARQDF